MSWRWTAVTLPAGVPAGNALAATAFGGLAHLLVARPDGGIGHLAVGADGRGASLPDLPLESVSGVAAGPSGLLVAGARRGDDAPALCTVDTRTGEVSVIELPRPVESDGSLAAWPVPVGGAVPGVVWAVGRDPATVLYGRLADTGQGITVQPTALTMRALWTVQAVAAADAVDVLVQGSEGTAFARVGGTDPAPQAPALRRGAVLSPGAVLTPAGEHRVEVWDTVTGARRALDLPEPPEGAAANVTNPRLLPEPGLLVWSTETPDSGSGSPPARTLAARGWIATLDTSSWQLGPPAELPTRPAAVVGLGDRVVVAGTAGTGTAWVGTPLP